MNTTPVNPKNENSSKKNVASHAATATAAAGLGAVGATMASELSDKANEEINEDIAPENPIQEDQEQQPESNPAAENTDPSAINIEEPTGNASADDEITIEPEPITLTDGEDEDVIEVEEIVEEVEEEPQQGSNAEAVSQETIETINPDDIAEAIIAEDQVDPNDIDMADVVNFDEIGTVYTVDGDSYTAASFHDAAGNQLVMVDVDGDDVFDVITDMEGNVLTDPQGNILAAGNVTVDDAEINIADSHTYLAANDTDTNDDYGIDSLMNDIIS